MADYPIYSNPYDAEGWTDTDPVAGGANSPQGYGADNLASASVTREFRSGTTFGDAGTTEIVLEWTISPKPDIPLSALLIQHTNVLSAHLEYIDAIAGGGWQALPDVPVQTDLNGKGRILLKPTAPLVVENVRVVLTASPTDIGLNSLDGANFWRVGAIHWFKNVDQCNWSTATMNFNLMQAEAVSEYANGRRTAALLGAAYMRLELGFDVATAFGDPGLIMRLARQSSVFCVEWPAPAWGILPLTLDERMATHSAVALDREQMNWAFRELVNDLEGYGAMTDQLTP